MLSGCTAHGGGLAVLREDLACLQVCGVAPTGGQSGPSGGLVEPSLGTLVVLVDRTQSRKRKGSGHGYKRVMLNDKSRAGQHGQQDQVALLLDAQEEELISRALLDACCCCGRKEASSSSPFLTCSRCKAVKFCGELCQRQEWGHESFCRTHSAV